MENKKKKIEKKEMGKLKDLGLKFNIQILEILERKKRKTEGNH